MGIKNTEDKFVHELSDAYDAEHQFLRAMEEFGGQTSDSTLQQLVQKHIKETQGQIKTLEQVYALLDEKPKREFCDGAKGLITEGQKTVKAAGDEPALRDIVIELALDKAEHYEIASYAGLKTGAQVMGESKIVSLIDQVFQQEQKTSEELEKIAPKLEEKASKVKAKA